MKASLAAVYLRKPFDAWLNQIPDVLDQAGYSVTEQKHSRRCWHDEWVQLHKGKVRYTDGIEIRRLWIGRGRSALGISPRRIYLDNHGAPDTRREAEILENLPRPVIDIAATLQRQKDVLTILLTADCTSGQLILSDADSAISASLKLHSGNGDMAPDGNLRMFLRRQGFHRPVMNLTLAIIPATDACRTAADSFRHKVSEWFNERGISTSSFVCDTQSLDNRLRELEQGAPLENRDVVTVFILPGADNVMPLAMLDLMLRMDELNLCWRRAHLTDDQTWSVEDQLGSLTMAAGGIPYFVTVDDEPLSWAIGIDISHPINAQFSTACAALTDPGGNLVHAWTIRHPRNEQMPEQSIRKLVAAAEGKIAETDSGPDILIIRDGRLFEHENARHYTELSVGRVTLLELRKGGNPLMLLGEPPALPGQPTAGIVPDCPRGQHVAFVVTKPDVKFGFAQVLKLHWEDRCNAIGMDANQLTRTICALSYAPGLGMHRHALPSPVYWADGIAGASDTDLRFRGQRVTRLD